MTVEVRPLGTACNIRCQYCYQNPQREAGNARLAYDLNRMKTAIEKEGGPFTLFGGEPLLLPLADLEQLWAWGMEKYGGSCVQTNATLINETHILMFKRYNVRIGISIDGPGMLNDARWNGSLEHTRATTARTEAAIERLCQEGIPPGLIVTLHRCNATGEKLPLLHAWFRHLENLGVTSVRLHILESEDDNVRRVYGLSHDESVAAFMSLMQLEKALTKLKFDIFDDMRSLLAGREADSGCVWNACDPYTTPSVRGVEGNGQSSNCGRTNKDGVEFAKSGTAGFERYLSLYFTPQEHGGCKGCRFFLMCKGQCPGTAIAGDWRNRTADCEVWKALYGQLEAEMIDHGQIPLSISSRRQELESMFLVAWATGHNLTLASALGQLSRTPMLISGGAQIKPRLRFIPSEHAHLSSEMAVAGAEGRGHMERLPFVIAEFSRVCWVSDRARAVWGTRLPRLVQAWQATEWLSVVTGVRPCCLTVVPDAMLVQRASEWVKLGLTVLPVHAHSSPAFPLLCSAPVPEARTNIGWSVALGSSENVLALKAALEAKDHPTVGSLLGYPTCCTEFYHKAYVEQAYIDTTWPMASNTMHSTRTATSIEVEGPAETNILWRGVCLRAVPHLPCRFDCEHSTALGQQMLDVSRKNGFAQEMDWLQEILRWPVEWSALHGIAELKTPILKAISRTDATAHKYVVRRRGNSYPLEGGKGVRFPYLPVLSSSQGRGPILPVAADTLLS